ncbi:hypothetical protein BD779DRAFT_312316 [Infundibulicybe gibba]|nr:hypothetical protein BD779DRAFT_312316 [Infundibulicybe gibba]
MLATRRWHSATGSTSNRINLRRGICSCYLNLSSLTDYDPARCHRNLKIINGKPTDISDRPKDPKASLAQKRMRELLPGALLALKGAETVLWEMYNRSPDWASASALKLLALAPGIKKAILLHGDSDVLANKFFTQVLSRLSKTLVSLRITEIVKIPASCPQGRPLCPCARLC